MVSVSVSISLLSLFLLSYFSDARNLSKPQAFVFPINKDRNSHQYYTTIQIGPNASTINVAIDLSGKFLWFNSPNYISSYIPIPCNSPQCTTADGFTCTNNTCSNYARNPFTGAQTYGGLIQDSLHVCSTSGPEYTVGSFPFQLSNPYLINGLGGPIRGVIGLGTTNMSLQSELASAFKVKEKFTLCMPASGDNGSMIVGGMTYQHPFLEFSKSFLTARFLRNMTDEYLIGFRSIRVGRKVLPLNKTLLVTSVQTARAFTSLEGSIYRALIEEFVKAAGMMNITRVESVAPFGACFDGKTIGWSQLGPVVPTVDFVVSTNVYWRMYGANSVVSVGSVVCLAFVEEIPATGAVVVVGGRQMENHLVEFDVGEARLRFSPLLLLGGTSCAMFGA